MKRVADPMRMAVLVEFDSAEALVEGVRTLRERGYRRLDAYTPYPIDELEDLLDVGRTRIPWAALVAGLGSALLAYLLQWFCNVYDYPLAVGGRPLHSGLAYVPIVFEMAILGAASTTFVAFFWRSRLPEPWTPLFDVPGFDRASDDRFFAGIDGREERCGAEDVRRALGGCAPRRVIDLAEPA